jgi:hypothetical protein
MGPWEGNGLWHKAELRGIGSEWDQIFMASEEALGTEDGG